MSWVGRAADALWNPWLLGLFLFTGLVYSLGSGFFQLFGLPLWLRATLGGLFRRENGSKSGLSPLQALATALASTMGTGSIAGVATALTLGGPGATWSSPPPSPRRWNPASPSPGWARGWSPPPWPLWS